jgi:hypothetical protein
MLSFPGEFLQYHRRRVMGVWWPPRSSKPLSAFHEAEVGSIPTLSANFTEGNREFNAYWCILLVHFLVIRAGIRPLCLFAGDFCETSSFGPPRARSRKPQFMPLLETSNACKPRIDHRSTGAGGSLVIQEKTIAKNLRHSRMKIGWFHDHIPTLMLTDIGGVKAIFLKFF